MKILLTINNKQIELDNVASCVTTNTHDGIVIEIKKDQIVAKTDIFDDDELISKLLLDDGVVTNKPVMIPILEREPAGIRIDARYKEPEQEKPTEYTPLFNKSSSSNAPSKDGIMKEKSVIIGNKFELPEDNAKILNQLRRDFSIEVVSDTLIAKRKMLKKNILLRSDQFGKLEDIHVRTALQSLIIKEQQETRTRDRENLLFVEIAPRLVIESITDEQAGVGTFYYEEMISIYENIYTLKTERKED